MPCTVPKDFDDAQGVTEKQLQRTLLFYQIIHTSVTKHVGLCQRQNTGSFIGF